MSSSTRAESASAANFYSPQNVAFYASEPYAPLDKGTKEMRLVTILPASDDDFLRCELLPAQPLAVIKHQYYALSYCAGDPKQTTPILVNGLQFNAFASLGSVLHQLRRAAGAEQQLLWVDQICIDQRNPMERAHQVGLMRDIYESADRVIIWLGDQRYGDLGLQWLQAQADDIKTELCAVGLAWRTDRAVTEADDRFGAFLNNKRDRHVEDFAIKSESLEQLKGIHRIIAIPWWSRCWVFQEFVVARDATIMHRNVSIPWRDFKLAYCLFITILIALPEPFDHPTAVIWQSIKDEWNVNIESMLAEKTVWVENTTLNIGSILEHARGAEASDPRDHIYAFSGLVDPGYKITPNYETSNTVVDTWCHVARRIILHDQSLRLLGYATINDTTDEMHFPSWVPQWSSQTNRISMTDKHRPYRASGSGSMYATFLPNTQGKEGRVLRVRALFIDQVAREESDPPNATFNLIKTPMNYKGIVHSQFFSTDLIAVLFGAPLPCVIRQVGEQYQLISQAIVDGFMEGQAIEMMDRGELEAQYIELI